MINTINLRLCINNSRRLFLSHSFESNYRLPITPLSFIQFDFAGRARAFKLTSVGGVSDIVFSPLISAGANFRALICRPATPAGRERESPRFFVLTWVQIRRIPRAVRWLRHPGPSMRRTRHPSKSAVLSHPTRTKNEEKNQSTVKNYPSGQFTFHPVPSNWHSLQPQIEIVNFTCAPLSHIF